MTTEKKYKVLFLVSRTLKLKKIFFRKIIDYKKGLFGFVAENYHGKKSYLAKPKSATLTTFSLPTKQFLAAKSLCM